MFCLLCGSLRCGDTGERGRCRRFQEVGVRGPDLSCRTRRAWDPAAVTPAPPAPAAARYFWMGTEGVVREAHQHRFRSIRIGVTKRSAPLPGGQYGGTVPRRRASCRACCMSLGQTSSLEVKIQPIIGASFSTTPVITITLTYQSKIGAVEIYTMKITPSHIAIFKMSTRSFSAVSLN